MSFEYPAIFSRPRHSDGPSVVFASFAAPVGDLLKWTTITQLTVGGPGHQRIRNEAKVRAIKRFLELDNRNSIPTALTVALRGIQSIDDSEMNSCATLVIPDADPPPGIVIDGQHRLYGMSEFNPAMPVNIVALVNPDDDEIAFQFLVINNKATKVSTDHLKLLALNYHETALRERLRTARMVLGRHASLVGVVDSSADSPFFHAVAWPVEEGEEEADRTNLVLPAAIEQAIAAVAQKNLPDLSADDALLEFFFTLWSVVKEQWPALWVPGARLLGKVGVVTLTTFIIDDLTPLVDRGDVDISNPDVVRAEVAEILASLTPSFWTSEWSAKSLDTSAGRQLVVDALIQIRRNMRRDLPWYSDVQLVETPDTAPPGTAA